MQLAYATRGSLIIGFSVAIIATILSGIFGILGTYVGGIWDDLLALITNVMLVIPGLPLTIVIAVMSPTRGIAMVIIVLAITSWAGSARVLRAQTLSMRGRDYVLAAKSQANVLGESLLSKFCRTCCLAWLRSSCLP